MKTPFKQSETDFWKLFKRAIIQRVLGVERSWITKGGLGGNGDDLMGALD